MTARIVPFPVPERRPSAEELVARVREIASEPESDNIRFDHPHFQDRLAERNRTMRQVLEVLRHGVGVSEPKLDESGDWRIKLRRKVAGTRVQVVVVVKDTHIVLVTVI